MGNKVIFLIAYLLLNTSAKIIKIKSSLSKL